MHLFLLDETQNSHNKICNASKTSSQVTSSWNGFIYIVVEFQRCLVCFKTILRLYFFIAINSFFQQLTIWFWFKNIQSLKLFQELVFIQNAKFVTLGHFVYSVSQFNILNNRYKHKKVTKCRRQIWIYNNSKIGFQSWGRFLN